MQTPQFTENWDGADDWTGVTSAVERRKRQNRINQRAYRKRKHLQQCAAAVSKQHPNANVECEGERKDDQNTPGTATRSRSTEETLDWILRLGSSDCREIIEFIKTVLLDRSLKLQAPKDLSTLVRLNVLNALTSNAVTLSIQMNDLERDDSISPFNLQGPDPADRRCPSSSTLGSLRPTALQKAVSHHPWVDILPFPGMRDNILRLLDTGVIDEAHLCADLFGIDDNDGALAPLTVWGEACDARNWEISPGILRKWFCLVLDCPEVVESTNIWRQKRGLRKIALSTGVSGNGFTDYAHES